MFRHVLIGCYRSAQIRLYGGREQQRGLRTVYAIIKGEEGIAAPTMDFSNPPLYNPAFGTILLEVIEI